MAPSIGNVYTFKISLLKNIYMLINVLPSANTHPLDTTANGGSHAHHISTLHSYFCLAQNVGPQLDCKGGGGVGILLSSSERLLNISI